MKKKMLASVLALTTVLSTAAGIPLGAKADEEPYEIVMAIPTLGAEPSGLLDVENAVNEIVEPELGVKVTLYPISYFDLTSQQNLMITSGDKLDLASIMFTGVGSWVSKGAFLELDDLYSQYGADIEKAEGRAMAGGYYNGKLYAIPSEEKQARSYGFVARKDMVEELGFSYEDDKAYTMEDLDKLFAAYKEKYGDGYYCVAGTASNSDWYPDFYAVDNLGSTYATGVLAGGGLDDDTTVQNMYALDAYKEYAETMYAWAQAGYYSPDAATNTDANTIQIQSGYYLGCFTSTETDMVSNLSRDCGYEMMKIDLVPAYAETSMYQNTMWSIPTTCENPEKTFQFLNYLYADNGLANMLTNGLEGVSYVVEEQGERPGQAVIRYADGVDAANSPYTMPLHVYGDKLNVAVYSPMTLDYYTMATEFNENLPADRVSKTLGFVFNSESVATEVTAIDAVVAQYTGIIAAGAQDPAEVLPKFLEDLNAAGIDKVIAEKQSQLDAWLAEQAG